MHPRTNTGTTAHGPRTWSTLASIIFMIAFLDFVLHLIRAIIAGRILNSLINGEFIPNTALVYLLLASLISGVVGMATCIMSMDHSRVWNEISRRAAFAVNLISLLLLILTACIAIKHFTQTDSTLHDRKADALAGLALAQIPITLLHLILLKALKRHQVVLVDVARPVGPGAAAPVGAAPAGTAPVGTAPVGAGPRTEYA